MVIDFAEPLDYFWALLPEIVLTVSALAVLLLDVFQKGRRSEPSRRNVAWLALAGIAAAAVANGWLLTIEELGATGPIAIDTFRVFANFVFLASAALFVLVATRTFEREGLMLGEIYVLVMFAAVGMMVFAGTRDLMLIFLGLELMSIAVYVLAGANRRDRRSAEAALKYFLLGAFSSAFFLFGIALVFGGAGTVNLALISLLIGVDGIGANALIVMGLAFLMVGFAFKVSAVPFHMWAPDAYEGAPGPITGYMAAAVKAAAFAAFLRVFLTAFPGLYDTWGSMIVALALLTMTVANLVALAQGNVKRMLAYSSVAHAGYLLVALAAASTLGAASSLFYLAVYMLMTIGSFAVVGAVGRRGETRLDLDAYSGLAWQKPALAIVMTIFLLSLAGFPGTGGFIGKIYILRAALETGKVGLAVVLVLTSLVSYWYYLRVAWYMWFRDAPAGVHDDVLVSRGAWVALTATAVAVVLLGILPGQLMDWAEAGAAALAQPATSVLGAGAR